CAAFLMAFSACDFDDEVHETIDDSFLLPGAEEVTICHVPPGNPDKAHTITVGESAVKAHEKHGDTLGPCEGEGETDPGEIDPPDPGEGCFLKRVVQPESEITRKLDLLFVTDTSASLDKE